MLDENKKLVDKLDRIDDKLWEVAHELNEVLDIGLDFNSFEHSEFSINIREALLEEMEGDKELTKERYYALYDLQLGGFKGGHAGTIISEVIEDGAERIKELSQGDLEPCPDNLPAQDVLEIYSYEVREVTYDEYNLIVNFLSKTVYLKQEGQSMEIIKGVEVEM